MPQIDRWLDDSGIRDSTILPGMVTDDDRIALLRDADLFVLQSYTENFGISVVEALAAGTPVVISDRVNLWPDIVKYHAGLITPCEPSLAADAMLKVLRDERLRLEFVQGGATLINKHYSRAAVVRQLQSLYRKVAGKGET